MREPTLFKTLLLALWSERCCLGLGSSWEHCAGFNVGFGSLAGDVQLFPLTGVTDHCAMDTVVMIDWCRE